MKLAFLAKIIHTNCMDPALSFEAYKNKLIDRLARKVITAYEQEKISEDLSSEIAQYILENIDKAKTNSDLLDFLEHISDKWEMFKDVLVTEEAGVREGKNQEKVEQIEELIGQNNINGAIKVVEEAKVQDGGGSS